MWTTLLSALPFVAVFAVSCWYGRLETWPSWLYGWLWYSYGALFAGAVWAWWLPYLFLPNPERAARYKVRFADTMRFLPERNGIAPDTMHVLFHLCVVATLVLLAMAERYRPVFARGCIGVEWRCRAVLRQTSVLKRDVYERGKSTWAASAA